MKNIEEWSVSTWKQRHDRGYFPNSQQHRNWKVYSTLEEDFLQIAKPLETDTCLELGCGYGEWMIPLSKQVKSVHGCDIHPEPLKKALDLFNEHKVYNCSVGLIDGTFVTGPKYTLVYSISVFQHLPRLMVEQYLTHTKRLLTVSGRCIHHFRKMTEAGQYPRPADDIELNHTGDFSCGWTKEEVLTAFEKAQFNNIQIQESELFFYALGTL